MVTKESELLNEPLPVLVHFAEVAEPFMEPINNIELFELHIVWSKPAFAMVILLISILVESIELEHELKESLVIKVKVT